MTMRRGLGLLGVLVAAGLLLVAVRARREPAPAVVGQQAGAPVEDAARAAHDAPSGAAAGESRTPGRPVPDAREALGAPDPARVWRAQVARALRRIAIERLGHPLAPGDETRVLDALKSVGPAARGLDRDALDPDDPASLARVREQTATLVAADRVCRAALGIGVSELIRSLDPSAIDDQGAPRE